MVCHLRNLMYYLNACYLIHMLSNTRAVRAVWFETLTKQLSFYQSWLYVDQTYVMTSRIYMLQTEGLTCRITEVVIETWHCLTTIINECTEFKSQQSSNYDLSTHSNTEKTHTHTHWESFSWSLSKWNMVNIKSNIFWVNIWRKYQWKIWFH